MTIPASPVLDSRTFDLESASAALPGPDWLAQRRATYVARLQDVPFPTTEEELWRYTDINRFDLNDYRPLTSLEVGNPGEYSTPGGGVVAAEAGEHCALIIVRDGRVVHHALDPELEAQGVVVTGIAEAQGDERDRMLVHLGSVVQETEDTFTLLNEAMSTGGTYVYIPDSVLCINPIVIVHWCEGDDVAVFDRTLVHVGRNAQASIIERFESSDQHIFMSSITECIVEENAHVKFLTTQEDGQDTTHIGVHRTHVYRDGHFESSTVSLGGKYARLRGEVSLMEQGSTSDVMAVYYGDNEQLLDFRTLQDHRAPRTTSTLLFKGAVEDKARSVYSGMIHLREVAQGAQAYQTNRNLVLDHGAHAESIPNLMIEANDVKCSHGSTVGPIDEEQLYYLATRGVSPADAEKLIVLGFFEDVFSRLSVPALIAPLRRSVNKKISTLAIKRGGTDELEKAEIA